MIEARPGGSGTIMITFRVPPAGGAERICVMGEFNDWSRVANPMERGEEGFVAQISLPVGRVYRFRYLLDGERWQNDWAADSYVANEFGGDDSVIDLTATGSRAGMSARRLRGGSLTTHRATAVPHPELAEAVGHARDGSLRG